MSKKYLLFSALGHSLLFASIALPAHASRGLASDKSCQELIDVDLAPFREQVRSIWVNDNLFMYVEVSRLFSHELLDKDPGLRSKIEDFKAGKAAPTATELQTLLNAKAEQVSGFANSLSRRFGSRYNNHWFEWHYPVIHVGDKGSSRVTYSLPVNVGEYEIQMELGPDSAHEEERLLTSAARIVALRSGVLLPHSSLFAPEFRSEKDFLLRKDRTVRESCLVDLWPRFAALDLRLPAQKDVAVVDEPTSRGYWEHHWITGYPTSNYSGTGGGRPAVAQAGGPSGGAEAAPAATETAPAVEPAPAVPVTPAE